ncbi:MAG TPA: DUF6159 family protein [Coxiellaceae bacterium]|nr:DUF6159 family protein [Coxiellaceae bacterium]
MPKKIRQRWVLLRQSFQILRAHKRLALLVAINKILRLVVLSLVAAPLYLAIVSTNSNDFSFIAEKMGINIHNPWLYIVVLTLYLIAHLITLFCYAALLDATIRYFRTGHLSLMTGIRSATHIFWKLYVWALLNSTLGFLIRLLDFYFKRFEWCIDLLVGGSWTVSTYFVLPVLVVEKPSPWGAIKRSIQLLRHTWGQSLLLNFTSSSIFFFLLIIACAPLLIGLKMGGLLPGATGAVITVPLVMLVNLFNSTMGLILNAALYVYAADGKVPNMYEEAAIKEAFMASK